MADDSGYHDNSPTRLDYAFAGDMASQMAEFGETRAQTTYRMGLSEAYGAWLEGIGLVWDDSGASVPHTTVVLDGKRHGRVCPRHHITTSLLGECGRC